MLKRVVVGLLGLLLVGAGAAILGGAGWVWTAFAAEGASAISLGNIRLTDGATAAVIDISDVNVTVPYLAVKGRTELVVGADGGPVSVIAGDSDDIDRALAGTRYDAASYVDGAWLVREVPGGQTAVRVPEQAAVTTGEPAVLEVQPATPMTIAVVPAEPGPGDVSLALRYLVPDAALIAQLGGVLGAFIVVIGLLLIWVAIFAMRARGRHE